MARTLGRTLDELGQTMTVAEFADHWGDYLRSPWGNNAWYSAQIVQAIWNAAGKVRKEHLAIEHCVLREAPGASEPESEVDPSAFFNQFMK